MNSNAMPIYKQSAFASSDRAMPNRILFWETAETTIDFVRPGMLRYEEGEEIYRPGSTMAVSQD